MDLLKGLFSLLVLSFVVIVAITLLPLSLNPYRISNQASISGLEFNVYTDSSLNTLVTSITWGEFTPGENKTLQYFIKRTGAPGSLDHTTTEWEPPEARQFINLTIPPQDFKLNEVRPVNFTLKVSSNIENITNFSFNINLFM